jgi:hypothetical protein
VTPAPEPADPVEADDTAAPFVAAYTLGVVAWLVGFLAWVFWFRGYA